MAEQSRKGKIRASRSASMMAVVVGVGMILFVASSFGGLRSFGSFGILWVVGMAAIIGYHLLNVVGGENRPSLYDVDLPGAESSTSDSRSVEERLEQLDLMHRNGKVTADEYETQRQRILGDL